MPPLVSAQHRRLTMTGSSRRAAKGQSQHHKQWRHTVRTSVVLVPTCPCQQLVWQSAWVAALRGVFGFIGFPLSAELPAGWPDRL